MLPEFIKQKKCLIVSGYYFCMLLQNRNGFATLVPAERQGLRYLTSKSRKMKTFVWNEAKVEYITNDGRSNKL